MSQKRSLRTSKAREARPRIATDEELLALLLHRTRGREASADLAAEVFATALADSGRPGGLAMAVGALKRSKGVVRGAAGVERSFFEVLEADLIQAATLLSGVAPEPPRRRLRWRP